MLPLLLLSAGLLVGAPDEPAPAAAPAAVPEAVAPAAITDADALLTALEQAGVTSLTADLRLTKEFGELEGGDRQVRFGTLLFATDPHPASPATDGAAAPAPRRRFQVDFTHMEVDDARREDRQTFVFDGEWLVEKNPVDRQIFKRQVVAPGEVVDPLAIGEGPFPIPIGQKRERILERFEASLVPPEEAFPTVEGRPAPDWLKDTWQLRLVPRRGTDEARDFREVRIWYRRADLLPRMARTTGSDDAVTEVFLTDMAADAPMPEGAFDTSIPPGWNSEIKSYRKGAGSDG